MQGNKLLNRNTDLKQVKNTSLAEYCQISPKLENVCGMNKKLGKERS